MRVRRLSCDDRKQVICRLLQGASIKSVVLSYERCGERVCRQTIWRLLKHYHTHNTVLPLPRSGRPTKLTREVLDFIDRAMDTDDVTTAREIQIKLREMRTILSKRTVLKGRKRLGWTSRGTAYCQLIRDVN